MVIGIVALAIVTVRPFIQRAIQSVVKVASDQVAPQSEADEAVGKKGYLLSVVTDRDIHQGTRWEESGPADARERKITYGDQTDSKSHSLSFQGFAEDNN